MIELISTCPLCGCEHSVLVHEECLKRYQAGELAQDCFPMLTRTKREQIISQLCPSCQADVFGCDDTDICGYEED